MLAISSGVNGFVTGRCSHRSYGTAQLNASSGRSVKMFLWICRHEVLVDHFEKKDTGLTGGDESTYGKSPYVFISSKHFLRPALRYRHHTRSFQTSSGSIEKTKIREMCSYTRWLSQFSSVMISGLI